MKSIKLFLALFICVYSCLLLMISIASADQKTPRLLPRAAFDDIILSQKQSTNGLILEQEIGLNNIEPVDRYEDFRAPTLGGSVGLLLYQMPQGSARCTAFVISEKYIMTNNHCIPGLPGFDGLLPKIEAAKLVLGYHVQGVLEGTKEYFVNTTPVETNVKLDYSILEVFGNPSDDWGSVKIASISKTTKGAPLWIFGHPLGKALHVSREGCKSLNPPISAGKLRHSCDTLGGSSGSPVFNAINKSLVALHHAGDPSAQINLAIPINELIKKSKILADLAEKSSGNSDDSTNPTASASVKEEEKEVEVASVSPEQSRCDRRFLKAEDSGKCYLYDAFYKSCPSHPDRDIAESFLSYNCKADDVKSVTVEEPKIQDEQPVELPTVTAPRKWVAVYNNVDFSGADLNPGRPGIAVSNMNECVSKCVGNPSCQAFTFNANTRVGSRNCFLKHGSGSVSRFSGAFSGYVFTGNSNNAPRFNIGGGGGMTTERGIDYLGNDLYQTGAPKYKYSSSCAKACSKRSNCRAYTYISRTGECWMKHTAGNRRRKSGLISGVKTSQQSIGPSDIF